MRRTVPTVRAIVNADDLGMSETVNEAIFESMRLGRVTSATLMANAPGFDHAVANLGRFASCSFGVHLNITQFEPLTRNPDLGPILDSNGAFNGGAKKVPMGGALRQAIRKEWDAQVERVYRAGVKPSHLDSHHFAHTRPAVFPVLKGLQRKFGIERVRNTLSIHPSGKPAGRALRLKKALWSGALRGVVSTSTTDYVGNLRSFIPWSASLRRNASVEIIVHPGHPNYVDEEQTLRREWWHDLDNTIEFISYHEL